MGFGSLQSFEFMQRTAKMFTHSSMVPTAYRNVIEKGYGQNLTVTDNPSALPNCIIALNMSQRMNADPLMIMQNLHVIEGRPSWSSQFIIAAINSCGRYSPLRFDIKQGAEIDATCTTFEWENGKKKAIVTKTRVKNTSCIAWAVELATQTRLESPAVTMEMAVNEGWYGKNGSKWQSMPDLMLRYRSAAFFGRIYAPELLMGLPSAEETVEVVTVTQQADGTYAPSNDLPEPPATTLKEPLSKSAKAAQQKQAAEDAPVKTVVTDPSTASTIDQETGEIFQKEGAKVEAAADGENSGLITASQVKYLTNKMQSIELPESAIDALLMRVGVAVLADLNTLQFDAIKAELLAMGA